MLIQKKDPKYCNGKFHSTLSYLGDGYCDNWLNNEENCFDGGDCDSTFGSTDVHEAPKVNKMIYF